MKHAAGQPAALTKGGENMKQKTQDDYLREMAQELKKVPEEKAQEIAMKASIFIAGCLAVAGKKTA